MRSYSVLLAILPLCFAVPNVRRHDEAVDRGLQAGRSCLLNCQRNIHGAFNLSFSQRLAECLETCPESAISPILKQDADNNAQICAKDWDQGKFQEFLDAQKRMAEHWAYQTMASCPRPKFDASRMFEKCSLFLDCFFGEALTAVKDGYDDLVVASVVVPLKLQYAQKIGGGLWTEHVVDECSVLFTPFEAIHMDPSFLPAGSCLLYCQTKYPGTPRTGQRLQTATYCAYSCELNDCLEKCQESPITPVIKQSADVNARVCGPHFGEEQLEAFFVGQKELLNVWSNHAVLCVADPPGRERTDWAYFYENCSVYLDCFFGDAFDAVKDDFDELGVVLPVQAPIRAASWERRVDQRRRRRVFRCVQAV